MNRRAFLTTAPAMAVIPAISPSLASAQDLSLSQPPKRSQPAKKHLAVITTVYGYLSHAYHIAGRFINGYQRNGQHHFPASDIASMCVEQIGPKDLSVGIAKTNGIRHCKTVEDALTLGTGKLAVDGVLLIAEHGNYPYNPKGQKLYPRYELFQQVVKVFADSGRVVPVFNDKHLSYDRKKGFEMVATAKKMGFPLLAGSSLPVTWRRPEIEIPLGKKINEAMVVGPGELEIYGIHQLEPLQAMVERRTDGQQGVKRVEYLEGEAVWKAGDDKRWSWELLESCLGRSQSRNVGDPKENCKHFTSPPAWGYSLPSPRAFLIEYRDGLKATVLQLDGHVSDMTFAAHVDGEKKPASTLFWLPPPPGAAFLEALAIHAETMMDTGKSPLPVERTMLTGGILDWVLESRVQKKPLETPDLDVTYSPPKDSGFMRGDYVTNPG
ncbi:hypothetical protein [Zavarzinella formosa]|uniref:hypothetical protein n=1 Tax=Zavarzinella formosa TaxID=360055 RepID=UPI0003170C23|nr:hypothetical protein [Zavarzinella formosa]